MSNATVATIEESMRRLATEFGLAVLHRAYDRHSATVEYANATTGLDVSVEWAELRPFLRIYSVSDPNRGVADSGPNGDPGIRGYDVDDLLQLRRIDPSPVGKMLSERSDVALARLLGHYEVALREHAADVFSGDTSVFTQLDQLVLARAAEVRRDIR